MTSPLPRRTALAIILVLGVLFGANHIAARVAFDHGTGLVTAVLMRSGITALALLGVVLWQRVPLRPPSGQGRWLLGLAVLIALQSLCLYSAVARIPVALALLAFNAYPVLYALVSWALGGPRPTLRAAALMGLIFGGLVLALDVPGRLQQITDTGAAFWLGVALALSASVLFALAMWVTDHRVKAVVGALRSFSTMSLVTLMLGAACAVALSGGLGGGAQGYVGTALHWPADTTGWAGLAGLTLLYGAAFSTLFVLMPRLDMARNAPAANIEPVAAIVMGWLLLGQTLSGLQIVGALLVIAGIVLLALTRRQ